MCKIRTLSREGETLITQSVCCGDIQIWHNNLILRLNAPALRGFSDFLNDILFDTDCVEFPGGEWKIIIHTPNPEISFAFNHREFLDFKYAIQQALYMSEVYDILTN